MALLIIVKLSKHVYICNGETLDDELNVTKVCVFAESPPHDGCAATSRTSNVNN